MWHAYGKDKPAHWYDRDGLSWCNRWRGTGTTTRQPELVCELCADPFYRLKATWTRLKEKIRLYYNRVRSIFKKD